MRDILAHARYNLLSDVDEFQLFELNPTSATQNINLWIGGGGPITHLHMDSYVNFNIQISGEKAWTVFHPVEKVLFDLCVLCVVNLLRNCNVMLLIVLLY
jgi:hypothetical protein